jgi:transcriptional regulator with XRE-family HTH domain
MTQEELAEKAGISVEFLSNLERGINAPSFETLEKLSLALSISVHFLFVFEDDDNNAKN